MRAGNVLRKREAGALPPLKGLGLGTRPPPVRGESTPENESSLALDGSGVDLGGVPPKPPLSTFFHRLLVICHVDVNVAIFDVKIYASH